MLPSHNEMQQRILKMAVQHYDPLQLPPVDCANFLYDWARTPADMLPVSEPRDTTTLHCRRPDATPMDYADGLRLINRHISDLHAQIFRYFAQLDQMNISDEAAVTAVDIERIREWESILKNHGHLLEHPELGTPDMEGWRKCVVEAAVHVEQATDFMGTLKGVVMQKEMEEGREKQKNMRGTGSL